MSADAATDFAAARLPLPEPAGAGARVAVVGAGLAGLGAAFTLAQHGVACTVYEAAARVGGRVRTDAGGYWADGQVAEWCGELVDSSHAAIRALAGRFGLDLIDLHAAQAPGAAPAYQLGGALRAPAELLAEFEPVRARVQEDRDAAVGAPGSPPRAGAAARLDALSVREWIERNVPGGRAAPLGRLLDVAYGAEFAADTSDQSALNLVCTLADQPRPGELSIYGGSDERFRVAGGNERLAQALAAALPVPVRCGWRLRGLAAEAGGRLRLDFDAGGAHRAEAVDHVVVALPFAVLRTLDLDRAGFAARKRAAIAALGRGHSAKLTLQFDGRPWRDRGVHGAGTGAAFLDGGITTWEGSRGQPGEAGILVVFTGGSAARPGAARAPRARADEPAVRARARDAAARLDAVFPGLAGAWNGRATLSLPALDPCARCSYPYYRVGQHRAFAGCEGLREGNVHFAGDHCSDEHQGFMEGAVREGHRAALEVIADVGRG